MPLCNDRPFLFRVVLMDFLNRFKLLQHNMQTLPTQ